MEFNLFILIQMFEPKFKKKNFGGNRMKIAEGVEMLELSINTGE
jgi:hypothetical protein